MLYDIEKIPELNKKIKHDLSILVDRIILNSSLGNRLAEGIETSVNLANGLLFVEYEDEQSGQDKFSTEIVIQGYNSSLTMLGGGNSSGGIANDNSKTSNNEDMSQISNDMDDEIPF